MKIFRNHQGREKRGGEEEMGKNIPAVWFSLKKSLHCKSEPSEVYTPTAKNSAGARPGGSFARRSGCSRSIANLRDVIHGSKRHMDIPPSCSPRSIGSSEFLNPIAHEVILSNSRCELKISRFSNSNKEGMKLVNGSSTFVGTLRPGTPGPGGHHTMHYFKNSPKNETLFPQKKPSRETYEAPSSITCNKCGQQFSKWEAAESHHLAKHAVTELLEGDSSRKIVEIICKTSWVNTQETSYGYIERVLKVHNMQKTLSRFEEYREMVKTKASKLPKKHPRCLADGNELLRFYGTTVACGLGLNGRSNLCSSDKCCVCRIIQYGFSFRREIKEGEGLFTTSTSGKALESITIAAGDSSARKALIVCRVIAGRVRRPVGEKPEVSGQIGFDSWAGKVGVYSNIEELYSLNPRALLPCFVVICKT